MNQDKTENINPFLKQGKVYKIICNGLYYTISKTKRHSYEGEKFTKGDIFLFLNFEDKGTLKLIFKGKVVYFPFDYRDKFNVWFEEVNQ